MDKLKVLLVDDEFLVRKGLTAILMQQSALRIDLHSAADGYEALEIARTFRPDVVITDINMPEMNGLELIEQMIGLGLDAEYLIITGHERFDFAKRALELGAVDYLVKPIIKEDLIRRLSQVSQRNLSTRVAALDALRHQLLFADAGGTSPIDLRSLRTVLPHEQLVVCVSVCDEPPDREKLGHIFEQVTCFRRGRISVCALNLSESISRDEARDAAFSALGSQASWGNSSAVAIDEGIDLHALYRQALFDLILREYGMDGALRNALLCCANADATPPNHVMLLQSKSTLKEWLLAVISHIPPCENYRAEQLAYVYAFTLIAMQFTLNSMGYVQLQQIYRLYFAGLDSIVNMSSLLTASLALIEKVNLQLNITSRRPHRRYSANITRCVETIERSYQQDLSLTDLAVSVNMQPSYLSHCFKKEVGESFLQYLHSVRIRHACEILRSDRSLPIERIAEQTGYQTPTHFFHVFKDYVGMSPGEYRALSQSDD